MAAAPGQTQGQQSRLLSEQQWQAVVAELRKQIARRDRAIAFLRARLIQREQQQQQQQQQQPQRAPAATATAAANQGEDDVVFVRSQPSATVSPEAVTPPTAPATLPAAAAAPNSSAQPIVIDGDDDDNNNNNNNNNNNGNEQPAPIAALGSAPVTTVPAPTVGNASPALSNKRAHEETSPAPTTAGPSAAKRARTGQISWYNPTTLDMLVDGNPDTKKYKTTRAQEEANRRYEQLQARIKAHQAADREAADRKAAREAAYKATRKAALAARATRAASVVAQDDAEAQAALLASRGDQTVEVEPQDGEEVTYVVAEETTPEQVADLEAMIATDEDEDEDEIAIRVGDAPAAEPGPEAEAELSSPATEPPEDPMARYYLPAEEEEQEAQQGSGLEIDWGSDGEISEEE
jgi:hypothetical protein